MRTFPRRVALAAVTVLLGAAAQAQQPRRPKVAAVVTAYYHNSHADVIVSRLLQTDTLDGKGRRPDLELVSLFTDQVDARPPDKGQQLAAEHQIRVSKTIEDALTLGTGKLAVDGVLLVAEHGKYPRSEVGQIQYPKRRLFTEIVEVFRKSGRAVPVFCDKHLSDTWTDAKWIYDTARELKFPMMAGSSLPTLWRDPPLDPARGTELAEVVAISYHTLDAYGFHALEMLQTIVERRKGGETGIKAVQCLEGDAVWEAAARGTFDLKLLDQALGRLARPLKYDEELRKRVKAPSVMRIEYADGLKASVLTLNGAVNEWAIAWRTKAGAEESTRFRTQEARPFMHFAHLLAGIEKMVHTGRPAWPVERTLMTSGALDLLHVSKAQGGKRLETPQLTFAYAVDWDWRQPPPPPPDRPIRDP